MAVIINTVDNNYFTLNGTTYAKIYQGLKQGLNHISIYNIYDTNLQILGSTRYNEFVIDGDSYGSQSAVIAALLPVILFSQSGGGLPTIGGTGKAAERIIPFIASGSTELAQVAYSVNHAPQIVVPKNTTQIISFIDPYGEPSINESATPYFKKRQYILKKGQGTYGSTGLVTTPSDFIILTPNIIGRNEATTFDLGNIGGQEISAYVNLHGPYLVVGTTIFETTEGSYVFSGEDGLYGLNETQTSPINFIPFGDGQLSNRWEKIHNLSLVGINTNVPELNYIANAVSEYGAFTCEPDQQMIMRTTTPYGEGVIDRYYAVLPRVTTIGGDISSTIVVPSYFRPDGQSITESIPSNIIIELGDIDTGPVEDYFNEGDSGSTWNMSVYRFIRATLDGEVTLWSWQGDDGEYGGTTGTTATADDFFMITGEPVLPFGLFKRYTDITAMLADQANQIPQQAIEVLVASGDTNLNFSVGETKLQAYYRKTTTTTGSINDYLLISAPYSNSATGLEAIDEGNGIGWRLKGRNAANYGNIGNNAIDLSSSNSSSTTRGARGLNSFAVGYNNQASAQHSIALGYTAMATGDYSLAFNNSTASAISSVAIGAGCTASAQRAVAMGNGTIASGNESMAVGMQSFARSTGEFSAGKYGTDTAGRVLNIGNGTSSGSRADILTGYATGLIVAPQQTIALITGNTKALITKEYADANYSGGTSSGLEAINEGNGIGWRLIGRDAANYGNIGNNAIDLGTSNSASSTIGATADYSTVGGGISNTTSGTYSTVGGGIGNNADGQTSTIAGGQVNTASGANSFVGGGYNNTASGTYYSTVSGGYSNTATGDNSTVGGGYNNTASAYNSTVGGGYGNDATANHSTVAGGNSNTASGTYSTVSGGINNTASDYGSVVGGGAGNTASGGYSIVFGGYNNTASGYHSSIGGGAGNTAYSYGEHVIGVNATAYSPNSATSWNAEDRIFNVGIGVDFSNRKDGLTVLKTGEVYAPSLTTAIINSGDSRVLITKEYADANYAGGGGSSDYVTGATFNTSDGVLTLARLSGGTVTVDLDGKYADDSTVVKLTTNQTVAGIKTFSSSPIVPTATGTTQATNKGQVDTLIATTVKTTGTQTVAGVKTFSSSPIVPTATTSTQAVNKGQLDGAISGITHPKTFGVACSDETSPLTTGTTVTTFRMPYAMTLTSVRANVNTAPTGAKVIVDVKKNGTTIFSTLLSIDTSEKTTTTASVPAVISTPSLADDDEITIDITQVGSTIAGKGLKLWLIG